jgi:hypothetical protein
MALSPFAISVNIRKWERTNKRQNLDALKQPVDLLCSEIGAFEIQPPSGHSVTKSPSKSSMRIAICRRLINDFASAEGHEVRC